MRTRHGLFPRLHRDPGHVTTPGRALALGLLSSALGCAGGGTASPGDLAGPLDLATPDAPAIEIAIAPRAPSVLLRGTIPFSATVTGASDTGVTWRVAGDGCSGSTCGEIDAAGRYRAPWCLPTPAQVTVTAAAVADPARTASATVTLSRGAPEVAGRYAFAFASIGDAGVAQVAGTFVIDAQGAVTGGLEDVVHAGGTLTAVPFTGAATSACFRRGRLALDFADHTSRTFAWAASASGDRFRFIEMDATGERGAGVALRVASTPPSLDDLVGDHVLLASGALPDRSTRAGLLARLRVDVGGVVSSGTVDTNLGGVTLLGAGVQGTLTLDPATGRGTATLYLPEPPSRTMRFALYPVKASEWLWVSSDVPSGSVPLLGGRSVRQVGGPFAAAALGGELVLSLVGTVPGIEDSAAALGVLTAGADGSIRAGRLDENDDATVRAIAALSGSYAVDAVGAGALSLVYEGGRQLRFILAAPGHALLLDVTGGAAGRRVAVGELEARSGAPYGAASLTGDFVLGTTAVPTRFTPVEVGVGQFEGDGTAAGMGDTSDIFGSHPDRTLLGGTLTVPADGRFLAGESVVYLVSPTRALSCSLSATQHQPTITVVER